jgi:hypothetical protein
MDPIEINRNNGHFNVKYGNETNLVGLDVDLG